MVWKTFLVQQEIKHSQIINLLEKQIQQLLSITVFSLILNGFQVGQGT